MSAVGHSENDVSKGGFIKEENDITFPTNRAQGKM